MKVDQILQASEIVSHAGCPDGIGAAMICAAAFVGAGMKPPPTNFIQYDTRGHEGMAVHPRQIFADITPPKSRWEEWKGLSPIVLDHHETVQHIVQALGGQYGGPDESGSTLAFDKIMMPLAGDRIGKAALESWRTFAHLCMTRDTWKTASPDWPEACALAQALLLYGHSWAVSVSSFGSLPMEELLAVGRKMHDKIIRQSKGVTRSSAKYDVILPSGTIKLAFFNHANGGSMSDIAHYMMDEMPCDAVVGYFYKHDNGQTQCVMSARTNGSFSASDLARSFGGGGHAKAAGFRLDGSVSPDDAISAVLKRIVELNRA
jgi:hypothetical protein